MSCGVGFGYRIVCSTESIERLGYRRDARGFWTQGSGVGRGGSRRRLVFAGVLKASKDMGFAWAAWAGAALALSTIVSG